MAILQVLNLGQLDYAQGLELQEKLVAARQQNRIPDTLVLLEHTPVITIGRNGGRHNILVSETCLVQEGITVHEVNRGGDVTYHGPGQLVGYPIVSLHNFGKDVHEYYAKLEQVFIDLLSRYALTARRDDSYPGVWIGDNKIVAIGVAVKKWVTMHGFAFNVSNSLDPFQLINPCGIMAKGVISLKECCFKTIDEQQVRHDVVTHFAGNFRFEPEYITLEECLRKL